MLQNFTLPNHIYSYLYMSYVQLIFLVVVCAFAFARDHTIQLMFHDAYLHIGVSFMTVVF